MTIKNISDSAWNKILLGFNGLLLVAIIGLFVDGKHDLRDDIKLLREEMNSRISIIDAKADNAQHISIETQANSNYIERQVEDIKRELAKNR